MSSETKQAKLEVLEGGKRDHNDVTRWALGEDDAICAIEPRTGQSGEPVPVDTEDSLAEMLRDVAAAPDVALPGRPTAKALAKGARVDDRFIIESPLGAGGMGVVYLAQDTELARRVAIKIIPLRQREVERAMREARTMARLNHPNVVTVHDVGMLDDDHLYIAMEYVRGTTARQWLAAEDRSLADKLGLFRDAADGLIAAHDAGLVHRDFKPDNVLVGDDGRVRIADFGLARLREGSTGGPLAAASLEETQPRQNDARSTLVNRSAAAGTPAYMAPEQRSGRAVDARADQFAFCVALWEAVFGRLPFAGADLDASMQPTRPRKPGRARWLEPVLRRGLEYVPDDRYPSLRQLLDAIERPLRRRRRLRWASVGAVAAASMAVVGFVAADLNVTRQCQERSQASMELWDAERSAEFTAHLETMDPNYGKSAATGFAQRMSSWSKGWAETYQGACVDAEQAPDSALHRARVRCLDTQLGRVGSVLDQLEALEPGLEGLAAVEAYGARLPRPRDCLRPEVLDEHGDDTHEPNREYVEFVAEIDRLNALEMVGDAEQGLPLAESLFERTKDPRFASLRGDVALSYGVLLSDAGEIDEASEVLSEAFFAARANDDDARAARIAVQLVFNDGFAGGDYEAARNWARHAEASIAKRDVNPALVGSVQAMQGILDENFGDYEAALAHYDQSLAALKAGQGTAHPNYASALNNRAAALDALGRLDEAAATYTEAIEARQASISTPDILLSMIYGNRGLVAMRQGNYAAAIDDQREALRIMTLLYPEDSSSHIVTLLNLGTVLLEAGRTEEAVLHLERAKALADEHLGGEHPDLVLICGALGRARLQNGEPERARVELERALDIGRKAEGVDQNELELVRAALGRLDRVAEDAG